MKTTNRVLKSVIENHNAKQASANGEPDQEVAEIAAKLDALPPQRRNLVFRVLDLFEVAETAQAKAPAAAAVSIPRFPWVFLEMEVPVQGMVGLLGLFSESLAKTQECNSPGLLVATSALGVHETAINCARELDRCWNEAHAQIAEFNRSGWRPSMVSVNLHTAVEKSCTLLELIAGNLAQIEDEASASIAESKGEIPEVGGTGYYTLGRECCESLRASFGAAYDQYHELERAEKQRAAA